MNQEEQTQFEMMVDAINDIDRATDPARAFYRAKRFLRDSTRGAEHQHQEHGVFALSQLVTSPKRELKRFRMVTMPKSMLEQRWAEDDFAHDPVITMAGKCNNLFTWSDANAVTNKRGRRISAVCAEHTNQSHGLVFPMVGLGMRRGCASIGLDISPDHLSPEQIMMIGHVVSRGYTRLDALLGPFAPEELGESLSARELDVLRRIAEGMTVAQTASDLSISTRTANEYLDRAKRKTGTTKTPHTVKVALQLGLMNF